MESVTSASLRARVLETAAARFPSGSVVERADLLDFVVDGARLPLIDYSRGIRNPQQLDATLSVVSSETGPYSDRTIADGIWRYDFRTGGPGGDNAKLIAAYELKVPMMLFRKLRPNVYQALYPVFVTSVDRNAGYVTIAIEDLRDVGDHTPSAIEKRYASIIAKRRIHQPAFRAMVLRAYETRCTVCRFGHAELLDAAHITADSESHGDAEVTNGMSMCKIHHAAYDQNFLGISPDLVIHVNRELLAERDGPMLRHGLQEMHGQSITVPKAKNEQPHRDRLAARFEAFSAR
ncbi:HNH endonuclease [Demequina sp. SYSU T00039]|uniref:HNH endonuclease n=1 Tax=Demequina lignilytica TaxID=3051663 RepID=A0AAW7M9T9_9MICO|nr:MULTISPECIES: HNH endonuclease [unclassified Demequina]MDN4478872.1 HNH endonuclease [Demequina sp. SYSU T00039-1]MDN4488970.1 HNH endonuclease [Demequina sp. SYSU T00039]